MGPIAMPRQLAAVDRGERPAALRRGHDDADRGERGDLGSARTGALQHPRNRDTYPGVSGSARLRPPIAKMTSPTRSTGAGVTLSTRRPKTYCSSTPATKYAATTRPTVTLEAPRSSR